MGTLRFVVVLAAACSTEFAPHPCSVDGDCGTNQVCELVNAQPVCLRAEDAPIVIGHHSALSGTNQALGTNMKLGIELAIKEKNDAGGIRGRPLVLEFRDDAYDPTTAEAAARALLDVQVTADRPHCPSTANPPVAPAISDFALERGPNAVLAMLGNVGTPTMVRAAPVAVETGTVFFGAFTGAATVLRDDRCGECSKYIFNVRASYAQEAHATMEFFKRKGVGGATTNYKNLISFDQNDTFGQAGYDGLVEAYKEVVGAFPSDADANMPIKRFRYTRNDDASVPAQAAAAQAYLAQLLGDQPGSPVVVGIMMTDTYGAATEFIKRLRDWQHANDSEQNSLQKASRLKLYFSNVSFVGPNALSERLKSLGTYNTYGSGPPAAYADGVVVSQVVPNYQSDNSDVVSKYNQLIALDGRQPSFTSLEGYIATRIFIAGLDKHKGPFTAASLVGDFETLGDLGLGIGASSGFKADNHQYSQSVWGTVIQADGTFRNLYFWSQGIPIQFFD